MRGEAGSDRGDSHSCESRSSKRQMPRQDYIRILLGELPRSQMGWLGAGKAGRASDLKQRRKGRKKGRVEVS